MSGDRQDQHVGEGAEAYQSGRDTIIYKGISREEMSEIMVQIAKQMAFYFAEGEKKAEERISSFREELLKQFAPERPGNPEAFKDPDFQWLLGDAQTAYARSGDESVRDTLVDIIARRSQETTRSRLAITLNDAATTASQLTNEEFSLLSLVLLLRYSKIASTSPRDFINNMQKNIFPFINSISPSPSTFMHIAAKSCGSIDVRQLTLLEILRANYGGVLSKGFTREDVASVLPGQETIFDDFLIANPGGKLRLTVGAEDDFRLSALSRSLNEADIGKIWQLAIRTFPSLEEICASYYSIAPSWKN